MAISELGLQNLARSVDLRIEALNTPTAPGQPQVFQVRPSALLLSAAGDLIPTEPVLNDATPIDIAVKWGVETADGTPLDQSEAVNHPGAASALETTVMVLPDFVELRTGMELPVKTRYVTATATLAVREHDTTTSVELVRHPISVPAVPVPTVALFFAKPDLGMSGGSLEGGDQFVIVLVPRDSPLGSISALRYAVEKLREVTSTAAALVGLAGFGPNNGVTPPLPGTGLTTLADLGAGLEKIMSAFDAHALIGGRVGLAFVAADAIADLNNVDTILEPFLWNDVEAEDTISSLVLLGPPGRRLRCFKDTYFRGWNMSVTTSSHCVTIANVPTAASDTGFATDPPGYGSAVTGPLDDELSSVAFL